MARLTADQRREMLQHFAGQALRGFTSEPELANDLRDGGPMSNRILGVIVGSAWKIAEEMVAHYEQEIIE